MQQREINFQSLINISRHMTLDEFHSRYKNIKIIHQTRNSTIRLAIHIQTGQNIIIKSIYKNYIANSQQKIESILKEVNVLTFLRESKHVTQIYDVIYCMDSFHIVLEYAECGDLFNFMNRRNKKLTETEIKHFFKPISKTVAMIHSKNIAHRDLKLENVLLDNSGRVMIGDFGFATKFNRSKLTSSQGDAKDENSLCSSICGTVYYEPPEIIQGDKYDPMKADSWSVGVMLYVLMFKVFPFYSPSITDTVQLIMSSDVQYPDNMRQTFSDELCDILVSLLVKDPKERIYIDELINQHPQWFSTHPIPNSDDDKGATSNNVDDFNIFNTDALKSLFGINSTASIGNVMKQERIHNSALNTITCSKDDFENLTADEFISYQIIKRRYQLGQMRYMKTRVKSIAAGEFMKIPPNSDSSMNISFGKSNKSSDDEYSGDSSIDTNLIEEDYKNYDNDIKKTPDTKIKKVKVNNNKDTSSDFCVDFNDNDDNNNNNNNNINNSENKQINLTELYKSQDKVKKAKIQKNACLPSYNPQANSSDAVNQIKPRSMSPNGARHIFKVKGRPKKTPSLSLSPIQSPTVSRTAALPSLLVSNSTPLSSQLPPPNMDTIEEKVEDDQNQHKKLTKETMLNKNASSMSSIRQELVRLPDLPAVDQLSNGLSGLDSENVIKIPNSDNDISFDLPMVKNHKTMPNLSVVHSRKRSVNRSPMNQRRANASDEGRMHLAGCGLGELIAKVNEFIARFEEIHVICEEESGVYVKVGEDNDDQLFVMITFSKIGANSSSYSLNKTRGKEEDLDKFEDLIVDNLKF